MRVTRSQLAAMLLVVVSAAALLAWWLQGRTQDAPSPPVGEAYVSGPEDAARGASLEPVARPTARGGAAAAAFPDAAASREAPQPDLLAEQPEGPAAEASAAEASSGRTSEEGPSEDGALSATVRGMVTGPGDAPVAAAKVSLFHAANVSKLVACSWKSTRSG